MPAPTSLSIQQLYDDNRERLELGWFAGFSGGERMILGDAASAADQVGHLNLIHPGRIQVFGHQELNYYQRLKTGSRTHAMSGFVLKVKRSRCSLTTCSSWPRSSVSLGA